MAHGANAGLVGRRLEDIIGGIPRFDGVLNGTQLHLNFVAAAEKGGAWRAYSWINEGDTELYLKLAYLTKVQREGREYYIGVGLSDRPLSEVQGLFFKLLEPSRQHSACQWLHQFFPALHK